MKLSLSILFSITYLHLQAQEIPSKGIYDSVVVDFTRSSMFVCFPLWVQKNDGSVFRALTSNYGLSNCYYDSKTDYTSEFADTVKNILAFEFVGLKLDKCPSLKERAIDNTLYKKLVKLGVKKTIKKYFDIYVYLNNERNLKIKRKYLSKHETLTVLCFMCDNYYIITSDNDGNYVANLLSLN